MPEKDFLRIFQPVRATADGVLSVAGSSPAIPLPAMTIGRYERTLLLTTTRTGTAAGTGAGARTRTGPAHASTTT